MPRIPALVYLLLTAGAVGCTQARPPAAAAAPERRTAAPPSWEPGPEFWKHWSDGQAEVAGYELKTTRYGVPRTGSAVAIFVTETFSESSRVKADPGVHPPADEFPVIKLNLVKDYQTGIYDYNEMLTVFTGLKPSSGRGAGTVAKVSFSAQEWCGHIYAQILPAGGALAITSHSYFDGQADQVRSLPDDGTGFFEDSLLLWARGAAGPAVDEGGKRPVRLLPSMFGSRGAATKLRWEDGVLAREAALSTLSTPAGRFQVRASVLESGGQPVATVWTETAAPHRVVQWKTAWGEEARLTGSARLKYWELNGPGGEKELRRLGLSPRPPRTM